MILEAREVDPVSYWFKVRLTDAEFDKLIEVLTYAKNNIRHPDDKGLKHEVFAGVRVNNYQTSEEARKQSNERVAKIEDYESFKKKIEFLLKKLTVY
jgi:hypothetical protein